MSRGGEMPSRRRDGSAVHEPVRAHQDPGGSAPAASDLSAEREARRRAREDRRGPRVERPEQRASSRRRRPQPEAPLMQGVVSAGIVGTAVVTAAIMGSQDVQAWLIGLAVSVVSLLLAGAARLLRRPS